MMTLKTIVNTIEKSPTFFLLIFIISLFSLELSADIVILKSGDTFNTSKAWEDNGKVKFYMQDLIVSVPLKDVAKIVKGDAPPVEPPPLAVSPEKKKNGKPAPQKKTPRKPQKSAEQKKRAPPDKKKISPPPPSKRIDKTSSGNHLGFRGLHWRMDRSHFKGFVKSKSEDGIDLYFDPDDSLKFGSAFVDGVIYGFVNEKLYTITIWTDGEKRYRKMKKEAFKHYGEGRRKNETVERFIWSDTKTDRLLEYDKEIKTGILWMRSHQLAKEIP